MKKFNLRELIQQTNKDFRVALYTLWKATHDMRPKTLIMNTPTEYEVIDAVPTLWKIILGGNLSPLSVYITYLSEIRGNFLVKILF